MERPTSIEQTVETLERLRRHVEAVRSGSRTAKDDIATVLHLLVGEGDGYGTLGATLVELGAKEPIITRFAADLPDAVGGLPVVLAIKGVTMGEGAPVVSLSSFDTCGHVVGRTRRTNNVAREEV